MAREPDGFWTDDDRAVTDPTADELLVSEDDDYPDLDDWGIDADDRAVEADADADAAGDRDFYRDDR